MYAGLSSVALQLCSKQLRHDWSGEIAEFTSSRAIGWLSSRVVTRARLRRRRARVQIAAATLSDNSLRQTVHTHRGSVHQAAKLIAALLRVMRVIEGLAESDSSLPPGL